ncbi:hypothetical protein ACVIKP_006907 [Rhizobium leguminosarum]
MSLAFCWSHVRSFYELAAAGPAPIASEALRRIAELYKIEDEIRGRTHEERSAKRIETSRQITDSLAPWLREQLGYISQKTKLAEAIRYALSRWEGLTRFIDDGRIEIDSNIVERSIRPIAGPESLCTPSLSICKHRKRVRISTATRAVLSGYRGLDRRRREVAGPDLIRRTANHLFGG